VNRDVLLPEMRAVLWGLPLTAEPVDWPQRCEKWGLICEEGVLGGGPISLLVVHDSASETDIVGIQMRSATDSIQPRQPVSVAQHHLTTYFVAPQVAASSGNFRPPGLKPALTIRDRQNDAKDTQSSVENCSESRPNRPKCEWGSYTCSGRNDSYF